MTTEKGKALLRWTASENYQKNYEKIFGKKKEDNDKETKEEKDK